ncbi:MAG: hypothetical protein PHV00_05975 [Syntrophales bacterium]|jgi:hypothetical protein|nr:hypothetical protein [Syntrophales bacterium]
MAAITSSDVTVTVNAGDRLIGGGGAFKNLTLATIAFGDATLTYPTGGVPLPAIGAFGLHKGIDAAILIPPSGDGYVYKYDKTNHKIQIYTQGIKTGSTSVSTAANGALVEDSAGAETDFRAYGTAKDTSYDMGALHELGAAMTPAATTLQLLVIGQ